MDSILDAWRETEDPLEKAAIVAEATFDLLPADTALVTRRCVILHWFDLPIIEALLEDRNLTLDEMNNIYEQLAALPFVDTIRQGLTFQDLTRESLLKRYSLIGPELLQNAASLAAPIYEAREEDKGNIAEAFYCYIVAGNQHASIALQNELFERGSGFQDWHYLDNLLHLQEEAEQLPFVQPIPRTEQQFLLQGLIHRIVGKRDEALADYNQALTLNPKSAIAYINRGTTYAEQESFDKALQDYNRALSLDKNAAQAYVSRGAIHLKQARYTGALKEFDKAVEAGFSNGFLFRKRGEALDELGRYEEALVAYDKVLQFSAEDVEAHIGKGRAFLGLGDYEQALTFFEEVLRLNPDSAGAYRGKGQAFNGLERYTEALAAYKKALTLDARSAEAYRGKGKALSGLKRYVEASLVFEEANRLDPLPSEISTESEDAQEIVSVQGLDREVANNHRSHTNLWRELKNLFFPARQKSRRGTYVASPRFAAASSNHRYAFSSTLERGLAILVVCSLIFTSILLFRAPLSTLVGGFGHNVTPTASATAVAHETVVPTKTPSVAAGTVLCQYDTTQGFSGWSTSPQWKLINDGLLGSDGTDNGQGSSNYIAWSGCNKLLTANYAVEAQIQLVKSINSNGDFEFGIMLRGDGNASGYEGGMAQDSCYKQVVAMLSLVQNNFIGFCSTSPVMSSVTYQLDSNWHSYRAEITGNTIRLFIDGKKVLEASGNTLYDGSGNILMDAGQVGLIDINGDINVKSFKVTAL